MKKSYDENIDREIKQYLKNETDGISVPEDMFYKVKNEILRNEEKRNFNMKYKFLRPKTALIEGVICVLTTVSCVATTNLSSWYGSSSPRNDIKTFPSEDLVQKKVGFVPKYVKSFSNGFEFDIFNYSDEEKINEEGKTIVKFKGADFYYKKDGAEKNQSLSMHAKKIDDKYLEENISNNAVTEDYNGIKIEYTSSVYKAVPDGYEPSEEEKEQQKKGLLQIGYGDKDEKIIEYNTQNVSWYQDGISYDILNFDYNDLTQKDMINMAKEVIDQN